jgi:hypothetical protein
MLVVPFLVAYPLLPVILPDEDPVSFLWLIPVCIAFLWNGFYSSRSSSRDWHVPWFSSIDAGLAYGFADEDGIHFCKWFKHNFVKWRGIARVEYWPDRNRLLYLHLYSQLSPVIFAPNAPSEKQGRIPDGEPDTVDYISKKLEETWPGRSTFLICLENPAAKPQGTLFRVLSNLGIGRNTFFGLLSILFGYFYLAFRLRLEDKPFWVVRGAVWGLFLVVCVIAWACSKLVRKPKSGPAAKPGTIGSEPMKKLGE